MTLRELDRELNSSYSDPVKSRILEAVTRLGYWTRANPEQCLLATRGKPARRAKDIRRLVVDKRREHSRKPDCVRERIEKLVASPYLALFARETKRGWDCWGDQVALFDQGSVDTRRQPSCLTEGVTVLL